jgi:hypothetical protein
MFGYPIINIIKINIIINKQNINKNKNKNFRIKSKSKNKISKFETINLIIF